MAALRVLHTWPPSVSQPHHTGPSAGTSHSLDAQLLWPAKSASAHLLEQQPSRLTGSGRAALPVGHRPLIPAAPPSAHLPRSRAGAASTPKKCPPPLTSDSTTTGEPGAGGGADARVTSKPRSCEARPHGDSRCQRSLCPGCWRTAQRGPCVRCPEGARVAWPPEPRFWGGLALGCLGGTKVSCLCKRRVRCWQRCD